MYTAKLSGKVDIPVIPDGCVSRCAQYTIKVESRDALQAKLKDNGIPSMVYYPKLMHKQLTFGDVKKFVNLTVNEELCKIVLFLPFDPDKTETDIGSVVERIVK